MNGKSLVSLNREGLNSRGTKMLKVALLSTVLYIASTGALSAQQDKNKQESNEGVIVTDSYVLVPKTTMAQWQSDVMQLLQQDEGLKKQLEAAKSVIANGMGCS